MLDLFGNDTPIAASKGPGRLAERLHRQLVAIHGQANNKCGNCMHLREKHGSGKWFKCSKASIDGGLSTDWRCKWQACGLFEKEQD